jgi:hypothetical protein
MKMKKCPSLPQGKLARDDEQNYPESFRDWQPKKNYLATIKIKTLHDDWNFERTRL